MELNAVTRSVNDIFSLNKKYLVPRFQREYSWTTEEVEEFWDDINSQISIKGKSIINEEYFIGCIVLVGEDAKFEYQIVDGQQRLTTLTILIRAIVDRLENLQASGIGVRSCLLPLKGYHPAVLDLTACSFTEAPDVVFARCATAES